MRPLRCFVTPIIIKALGVIFDCKLKFTKHIDEKAGMLSSRGQRGLEAKFYGLVLVLGLMTSFCSHASWPRGLNDAQAYN